MRRNLATIDLDTGEFVEGMPVWTPPKGKLRFKMWLAVNNEVWDRLIEDKFDGNTLRVWMALLMNCTWQNKIPVSQREMAEQIGMDSANFSRYVNRLADAGLVIKTNKEGRQQRLELSLHYVWKGKAKEHSKALSDQIAGIKARAKSSPSPAVPSHSPTAESHAPTP